MPGKTASQKLKAWKEKYPERYRAWKYRANHSENAKARRRAFAAENPELILWRAARERARIYGLPFDIEVSDVVIPVVCPILGIKLARNAGARGASSHSPSLDKIIPSLGYVKGNVCVISMRANALKSNASLAELEAITAYIRRHFDS